MTLDAPEYQDNSKFVKLYKSLGLNVIPIKPRSKEPTIYWKSFQEEQYTGPISDEQNIGIICGKTSKGLVVVDLDSPQLYEDFKQFENETIIVKTGSRGYHVYFRVTGDLPNTLHLTNDKNHKVDVQSQGAYVISPGSIHPNGRKYEIISSVREIKVIDFHQITKMLEKLGFEPGSRKPIHEIVNGVAEGDRNNSAFKYACHLLETVGLDEKTAWHEIERWNKTNSPPLEEPELLTTFKSAVKTVQSNKTQSVVENLIQKHYFKTFEDNNEIVYYNNGVYKPCDRIIEKELESQFPSINSHQVKEVIEHIRRRTYVKREKFDCNNNVLNLKNGLYGIQSGELLPHTPDHLSTFQIPVEYRPEARCPNIIKFLKQIVRLHDIKALLALVSLGIMGETKFQVAYALLGNGSNGKSTYEKLVANFVGSKQTSSITLHQIENDRFAPAELYGKRFNLCGDLPIKPIEDVGTFKQIVGGDLIYAQRKFGQPFQFRPKTILVFSTNQIPACDDQSDAYFRRWIIIEFPNTFDGANADPNILQSMTKEEELSGFLNLIIQSGKELRTTGKLAGNDNSIANKVKQYSKLTDPVRSFLDDCVEKVDQESVPKDQMHAAYLSYGGQNGLPKMRIEQFGRKMKALGIAESRVTTIEGRKNCWYGVKLIDFKPVDDSEQSTL